MLIDLLCVALLSGVMIVVAGAFILAIHGGEYLYSAWKAANAAAKKVVTSPVLLVMVAFFVFYAGSKPLANIGADDAIQLVSGELSTNTPPVMTIVYTGVGVTTNTPVAWRTNAQSQWNILAKVNPQITTANGTNTLTFTFNDTNATENVFWWVGTSRPAVIVETTGITITSFVCSSTSVYVAWECDDPNCNLFVIQTSMSGTGEWVTLGSTSTERSFTHSGFMVGDTRYYRIISTYLREVE